MTAQITERSWSEKDGVLPAQIDAGTIYVLPTKPPAAGGESPRYADNVRLLPKAARAASVPLEFATPTDQREFLSEYSIDPEMWSLGLACLQIGSDWLIQSVSLFIEHRAKLQGYSREEAEKLPLSVSVIETSTFRLIETTGEGSDVLAALQTLGKKEFPGAPESAPEQ